MIDHHLLDTVLADELIHCPIPRLEAFRSPAVCEQELASLLGAALDDKLLGIATEVPVGEAHVTNHPVQYLPVELAIWLEQVLTTELEFLHCFRCLSDVLDAACFIYMHSSEIQ